MQDGMYHTLNPLTSVMILKLKSCNKSDHT